MGDAECMRKSAQVAIEKNSSLVVVSATSGTTNQLIELAHLCETDSWEKAETLFQKIKDKHLKIASDLKVSAESLARLEKLFAELDSLTRGMFYLKEASKKALDALVSLGERMSSILFCECLGQLKPTQLFDVRSVLRTDSQFGKAKPQIEKIQELSQALLLPLLKKNSVVVTQGFIGSAENGATTTLGRGGSDYSAALLAEAVHADILEIWTDVAGIATTDPRIYPQARLIPQISFTEASELATFGAKILHPATLLPALRKNIPVFVGSTFEPEKEGTWVHRDVKEKPLVRAFAIRKKQSLVTISTPDMLNAHGFLYEIFKIFNDYKISIDAITTSEISVALTVDGAVELDESLISALQKFADIQIEKNLSLISLIGNNINHTAGIAQKIFDTIPDINVRMICLGASKHNFCFLVNDSQGEETIRRLHKQFIA